MNLRPVQNPKAAPRTSEMKSLPPPTGGINQRDNLMNMAENDAILINNWICRPYGLVVRNGFQRFATNLPSNEPVDTLMQYVPATANLDSGTPRSRSDPMTNLLGQIGTPSPSPRVDITGANLFAAQGGEVFDITAGGPGPWVAQVGIVGTWFSNVMFQNIGGNFLLACPHEGGYFIYDGTDWVQPAAGDGTLGTIGGVDPGLFTQVFIWKRRVWFVEKDSTRGWYLPTGQITGIAKEWEFGEQFIHGGYLQVMGNWTQDAGLSIDDYLVAIASQGDICVFEGFDPDNAPVDFKLKGVWYCGPLPVGNRVVDQYGGDLYILSTNGVTQMTELLRLGETEQEKVLITRKINKIVSQAIVNSQSLLGWTVKFSTPQQIVQLVAPFNLNATPTMLVQDTNTKGWSIITNHPCVSWITINGTTFSGGQDGDVYLAFDGKLDNRDFDSEVGNFIRARVIPAYSDLGKPGVQKHCKLLRLMFTGSINPKITIRPLANYQGSTAQLIPTVPLVEPSAWGTSLWDSGTWGGGGIPLFFWLGAGVVGFSVSPQIDVEGYGGLLLAQYDWLFEVGGPL